MVKTADCVELELDAKNGNVLFPPLGDRQLRGKFDFSTIAGCGAAERHRVWGKAIPGQVIGLDPTTGVGYVREPLHDSENAELAQRIVEKKNRKLPPKEERFEQVDVPRWAYWFARLVDAGLANLVRGRIPTENVPKLGMLDKKSTPDEVLAAAMFASLTPSQKEKADEMLAGW